MPSAPPGASRPGPARPERRATPRSGSGSGGYSLTSTGLEQIGTELDCSGSGARSMGAWFELMPAPSQPIRLAISGGDLISAEVRVSGARVRLTLADRTRHETFSRTLTDRDLDLSSAEWIAEAPSDCAADSSCATLPLADFGQVRFAAAPTRSATGSTGAVSSPWWRTTAVVLGYGARAMPSALTQGDSAFSVRFVRTGG